jgi:hypothetical protein
MPTAEPASAHNSQEDFESADDFVFTTETKLENASFTGLVTGGAMPQDVTRGENQSRTGTARTGRTRSSARLFRRFDRVGIGFWLGGATFGIVGCLIGYWMAQDPVGRAFSAIWWGIYIGCFGASLGALVALFTRRASSSPKTKTGLSGRVFHEEGL